MLCSFFFKVFPEIILDGRLFIAEPPLYKVDNKKNPFVINKEDYNNRYIKEVMKNYKVSIDGDVLNNDTLYHLLDDTSSYVDDIEMLSRHYNINDRLVEMILEEVAL